MNKNQQEELDLKAADHILQNVFSACEQPPNAISLDRISAVTIPKCTGYRLAQLITLFMLVILLLLPLTLVQPSIATQLASKEKDLVATYEIEVQSILPIRTVSATLNGDPIAVSRVNGKNFSVNVQKNGILSVSVTLINNLTETYSTAVQHLDQTIPTISRHYREGDKLMVYVQDDQSGVDFPGVYAENMQGEKLLPQSYEEKDGLVVFAFPDEPINLFIPDRQGNVLQAVLTLNDHS